MRLFALLGVLVLVSCGCAGRYHNDSSCKQMWVDSLEVRVLDSLFSNVCYSRSQVLEALAQAPDSLIYYRLLALYGKTFFVSSDFDSIRYYNRRVKEYSRHASPSPEWNDVLSDVYTIEGNVWMQLNRPDSAIIDYKKACGYRLKGKKRQASEMRVLQLSISIWVLVCVLLGVGGVAAVWYMRKKREFLRQRFFRQINRVRMENLRSRISPHFTFNVLGREINRFDGSEEVKHHLVELVKYLRRSLELTENLSVSLQDELDFVRTYIELERGRVGKEFVATVTVEEGLDATCIRIPSMIVQIPVENAIKHGLAGKEGEKELNVFVSRETNGIRITVTDNGCGYLPQAVSATRGTGTGLKVLYQTVQLLNTKNKSDKIRFDITNRSDGQTGTEVSVYVPFHFSYDL